MSQTLTAVGYFSYVIAAGFIVLNVIWKHQTMRTDRYHSAVFVVTSIFAVIGCRALDFTPHGCNFWTVLIFVVLDFATPFVSYGFFKLIGVKPNA